MMLILLPPKEAKQDKRWLDWISEGPGHQGLDTCSGLQKQHNQRGPRLFSACLSLGTLSCRPNWLSSSEIHQALASCHSCHSCHVRVAACGPQSSVTRTLLKSSAVALISFQVLFNSWMQIPKSSSNARSWVKNIGW